MDVVMGYEAGADDYMVKPFSLAILISKVNAIFKRLSGDGEEKLVSGEVVFSKKEMKVFVRGEETSLTKNELRLFLILMEHPKQILSKNQLLEQMFDVNLFYLPLVFIPLFMFLSVLYIGKPYNHPISCWWKLLYIPAGFIVLATVIRQGRRNRMTPGAIKQGLDELPDGVCFFAADGQPLLVNIRMNRIAGNCLIRRY